MALPIRIDGGRISVGSIQLRPTSGPSILTRVGAGLDATGRAVRKVAAKAAASDPRTAPFAGILEPTSTPGPTSRCGAPGTRCGPQVHPPGPPATITSDGGGGGMPIDWGGVIGSIGTALVEEAFGGNGTPSEPPSGGNPAIPGTLNPGTPQQLTQGGTGCPPGTISYAGSCIDPRAALPGGKPFISASSRNGGPMAANGSAPMVESRSYSSCGRGMVLGMDGLCYDRRTIRNDQRMWPKGRKPLLTGGEMNAITKAARAARRVKSTSKKLQKLGLLPKPNRGARRGSPGVITKAEAARVLRS